MFGLLRKISAIGLAMSMFMVGSAAAHVVVRPAEVKTAERATFAVSVPNEHDTPVVGVRLVIPDGLTSVRPFAKAGWNIAVATTGEGEEVTATEITWTSAGGTVPVNLKDDFLFGAKAPAGATELKWKAYETYGDGTVVAWEQEPSEADDNKPYSVTEVITETETEASIARAEAAAAHADEAADRAFYMAVIALALGAAGLAVAVRKK